MSRPLDFIIFGVPRSGTKGLVRALNLHPHIYCAMERFHFRADHSRLTFPESFHDTSLSRHGDRAKIEHIRRELAAKPDVRHAGNKLPRYYFALDRLNREMPALRNVWIYRSPYGFIPSWNRREKGKGSGQWPAGQVGLFGLLELLVCIENCLNLPSDVFIFPYARGLGTAPDSTIAVLDFLGADPGLYDHERFVNAQQLREAKRRHAHSAPAQVSLQDYEQEILEALNIRELDRLMDERPGLKVSEIAKPLRDYLESITDGLADAFDRAFSACSNRAVVSFAREYFHRNRTELTGFLKRTRGSRAVAKFQRFGLYQRLKALYVQRSPLSRRLALLRESGRASS